MSKVLENYGMDIKEKLDKIKIVEAQAIETINKAKAESRLAITKAEEDAAGQMRHSREKAAEQVEKDRLEAEEQINEELKKISIVNTKEREKVRSEFVDAVDIAAIEIVKRIKQGLAG